MTRQKHNKKRNTAFLYEALIREMTKAVVSRDSATKQSVVCLLKEFFAPGSVLSKELALYQALSDTDELDPITAEKLVYQVREAHSSLNKQDIYNTQSRLSFLVSIIAHAILKKVLFWRDKSLLT